MARNKKRKGAAERRNEHRTPLESHRRQGNTLVPPLAALPNLQLASWLNERLPEILWCALLVTHAGRDHALDVFRRVAKWAGQNRNRMPKDADVGHSALSRLPPDMRAEVLAVICAERSDREVLASLRVVEALPGLEYWEAALQGARTDDGWEQLRLAVAHVFDHQSQLATDCRWARIVFKITSGQMFFSEEQQELVEEIFGYPNVGDQREVRPAIRAMEISFSRAKYEPPPEWPAAFWLDGFRKTPCVPGEAGRLAAEPRAGTTRQRVDSVAAALVMHESTTRQSTELNARQDTIFGLAAYAVSLVRELLSVGNSTSILGRIGLRTLLEIHVTLAYLSKKESAALWTAFRRYGIGQAKLALLKLDEENAIAQGFTGVDILEMIANEDQSAEFVEVELGQWNATTLRQMAIEAGLKADYDTFYPWASAFSHANWGALRNANFDVCFNALHRAHRVLRPGPATLGDVLPDAVLLADRILETLNALVPGFAPRLSIEDTS